MLETPTKSKIESLELHTWSESIDLLVGSWLADRCVSRSFAQGHRTPARALYADFEAWLHGAGQPAPTATAFGRSLSRHKILKTKGGDGRIQRWPIRFKSQREIEADTARRVAAIPANAVRAAFGVR